MYHSTDILTGNIIDVEKIARQILNRGNAHRTVPKQECMVEDGDLPLVISTERTETISLSGSYKLRSSSHNNLVSRYRSVAAANPTLSLHQFCMSELQKKKSNSMKPVIPHYVGANGQPKFPPTKEYAMATLLVHKPWGAEMPPHRTDQQMIDEFNEFVKDPSCPKEVIAEYSRVKERYESRRTSEAVATEECYDNEMNINMDGETKDILGIVTNIAVTTDPFLNVNEHTFDKGLTYDWSQKIHLVSTHNIVSLKFVSPFHILPMRGMSTIHWQ